jgi:predicted MFS family arabinose efflux permease
MTNDTATHSGTPIIFDGWRSITYAVFMALVGYSVMVTVPVLSTALVNNLGFTAEQVGRVWGADLGGLSIGAILAALLLARVNRRYLVLAGVLLCIVANALCMFTVDYEPLLWLRIAAGIGSGIFTGTAVATLGGTSRPERAFNILLLGFSFSAAFELNLFPQLSLNGIYWFLMGTAALCALFLNWLPTRPLNAEELIQQEKIEDHLEDWHVPKFLPVICLTAVCFTYINIGGYFTYIELAALADGISPDWVGPLLTWSSFLALAGCVLALICSRFGLFKPLFLSLISMFAVVGVLSFGVNDINVAISLFGFMTLWTFVDVYQSAMVAHMDRSGSFVALLPAVQGFGQFVGPNIAASILGAGMGYGTMFAVSASMALIALVLYLGVSYYIHRRKPAQAAAA